MMRPKKNIEEGEPAGAPEWMVTFSDCMTLLLTFFVLLLSFSSFDNRIYWSLKVIYCSALTNISPFYQSNRDSFQHIRPIRYLEELDRGSEKPTLESGNKDGLLEEARQRRDDFDKRKVFIVSSKKVFWGNGTAVSSEGRDILSTMASFLKQMPNRVVISENGPIDEKNESARRQSLARSWAVLQFLTEEQGLDKKRFSISAASTLPQNRFEDVMVHGGLERAIEIVLLERSVYN
jgi:chemotaxis protein MotB